MKFLPSMLAALALLALPAQAQDKVTLQLNWFHLADHSPIYIALKKGYYKEEGLEVEIISPATSTDPIKLVARERADFSMTYVPDIMAARDTGIPVVSVGAMLRPLAYGMIVAPEMGIESPAGFKGKTVGVSSIPATRAYFDTMLASAKSI
jgi:putative hydroxymethylpyrimidine transport system substrate-binding protein